MASAQNRFLNQTVASASKTQTPNRLSQSVSTSQFTAATASKQSNHHQHHHMTQTSNSALDIHPNTVAASTNNNTNAASTQAQATTLIPGQQLSSASIDNNNNSSNHQQQQPSLKSGTSTTSLTQSQANLRTNMFGKTTAAQQPGYQPSYLREPAHKNSSYASVSPMKHQARLQHHQNTSSSVKKYGQHFSTSKRQGKLASDSKSTLGVARSNTNATVESKLRSGSQYVAAKKLYSGGSHHHHAPATTATGNSSSTTRGGHATQTHSRLNTRAQQQTQHQEEYHHHGTTSGEQHQTQRSQQPVENSFTRLHQGNSSVVRTFERKQQLLQQSTSQVRKSQQPLGGTNDHTMSNSRFQQNKFRNSNAPSSSSNTKTTGQNQLFQTKDRANTSSQLNMAQPYQTNTIHHAQPPQGSSNNHVSSAAASRTATHQHHQNHHNQIVTNLQNPMDSDRTADSGKADTARNGNNRYKGQTKQPRQSKSSSTKQSQIAASNQLRQQISSGTSEADRQAAMIVPHHQPQTTSSSALAIHHNMSTPSQAIAGGTAGAAATQSQQNTRLATSQSMTQVVIGSSHNNETGLNNNLPAANSSGLETSLSFTRRLIEETAARNERLQTQEFDESAATKQSGIGQEQDISKVAVSIQSNLITSVSEDIAAAADVNSNKTAAKNIKKHHSPLQINTTAQADAGAKSSNQHKQQFISPKANNKTTAHNVLKTGQQNSLHHPVISPINNQHHRITAVATGGTTATATTTGNETAKKVRGTSNNKVSNFSKAVGGPSSSTLNAAFSPDKRPNVSRSQIQNNLFLKRGGVKGGNHQTEKSNTRENNNNNRMQHQRMFAGQNSLNQPSLNSNATGSSISPQTKASGPLHNHHHQQQVTTSGPSYMQSTFTRSTKMNKNVAGQYNVHSYQLNRVRPQKKIESSNTTQDNIPPPATDTAQSKEKNNSSSQKDLVAQAAVKILDQQTATASLTQSQGPPKIGDSSSKSLQSSQTHFGGGRPSTNQISNVYSKPNIGGSNNNLQSSSTSAAKKTKGNAQSYQWPHHTQQQSSSNTNFYPGQNVKESNSNKSKTATGTAASSSLSQQPLSSSHKQHSRNIRPGSKRNSTFQEQKKSTQSINNQQSLSSGKSPLAMAVSKHHQSSTNNANKNTAGSNQQTTSGSEWQRRQSSLIISDQFVKGVIEQPINSKTITGGNDQKQQQHLRSAKHDEVGGGGTQAATRSSSKINIYNNQMASYSEVINPSATNHYILVSVTNSKYAPKQESTTTGNKGGKQQQQQLKKSISSLTETQSAQTISTDNNAVHSYKQKQEQIIEMIQSNMKRSEDIQQSLTSGSKFFQSANTQPPAVIHDFSSSQEKKTASFEMGQSLSSNKQSETRKTEETADEVVHQLPGLKAPTPSKASSAHKSSFFTSERENNTRAGGMLNHENQPDVPLFQPAKNNLKPNVKAQQAVSSAGTEVVEDVFNDAHLLQKQRITQEENTPTINQRISVLPDIKPAEQPDCGSESEDGTFGQEEAHSPINIMGTVMQDQQILKTQKQQTSTSIIEPKSAFAMALANKKANGEDFVPTLTASINQHQPFEIKSNEDEEIQQKQDSAAQQQEDMGVMKVEELEVVTEDVQQEDRYSLVQQTNTKVGSLPMKREAFINQYKTVLTQQELTELEELNLTNGTVYYANDIQTRTSQSNAVTNYDDPEGYYVLNPRDHILYRFEVIKVLGKGSFAQVVSAIDHLNGSKVAVKINRNTVDDHKFATQEAKLLKFLMSEDPSDDNNIVRMYQHIDFFRQHQCFVFELLNTDLFAHIEENDFLGFQEHKIRMYAAQLLKALVFLEKRKVIHCDLKPENILCVDQERCQIKVADFGSGCLVKEQVYTYVQSRYYRAPEVILRIRYSEKVDIWSLGCILAELFTGQPLFPGNSEQEQLEYIMQVLGVFPEAMIDRSKKEKRQYYFDTDYSPFLIEDSELGILRIPESRLIEEAIPSNDHLFLDFIAQCLTLDPEERPGAAELSNHPWISEFFGGEPLGSESSSLISVQRLHGNSNQATSFGLPQTSETAAYIPLRQPMQVQSFHQNQHESLHELTGNIMIVDNNGQPGQHNQHTRLNAQEYFDGRVSGSMQAMTEAGGFVGAQNDDSDVGDDETVKFGHSIVSRSRQREEAGARASAAEISPDRPIGSLLSDRQRMTSFISGTGGQSTTYQNSFGSFNIQPVSTSILHQSPAKKASPLKPSNESLLEHYKYEKQSRGSNNNQGAAAQSSANNNTSSLNFQEQLLLSAKKQQKTTQHQMGSSAGPANVEEPKIISMTTSGFAQQQKQ